MTISETIRLGTGMRVCEYSPYRLSLRTKTQHKLVNRLTSTVLINVCRACLF